MKWNPCCGLGRAPAACLSYCHSLAFLFITQGECRFLRVFAWFDSVVYDCTEGNSLHRTLWINLMESRLKWNSSQKLNMQVIYMLISILCAKAFCEHSHTYVCPFYAGCFDAFAIGHQVELCYNGKKRMWKESKDKGHALPSDTCYSVLVTRWGMGSYWSFLARSL